MHEGMQRASQEHGARDRVVFRVAQGEPVAQQQDERRRKPFGAQVVQRCPRARAHPDRDRDRPEKECRERHEGKARAALPRRGRSREARGRDGPGGEPEQDQQPVAQDDGVRDLPHDRDREQDRKDREA
jgi:hypothetical protein